MYKNYATAEALPRVKKQKTAPQTSPQNRPIERQRKLAIPRAVKLKLVGAGFCTFALAIATVAHFAVINQLNSQITSMENELDRIQNYNNQLEMKTVELRSHQRVERYAEEELGMERPEKLNFDYSNRDELY